MLMKKLSEGHYIICDDSDIKIGDIVAEKLLTGRYELFEIHTPNDIDKSTQKKVTDSTQPLEEMNHGNYKSKVFLDIKPLSLSEVKELIGVVDVEKKSYAFIKEIGGSQEQRLAYIDGYNEAIEDNKEKKYTEEDLRKAMFLYSAWITGGAPSLRVAETAEQRVEQIIQSLQPKTEWEVEIVDGKLKLKL